jgi:hypothetical protein
MTIEAYFKGRTPEEKVAEVYRFVRWSGLAPERALIRIFNSGLMDAMRLSGTDRAGIDEVDTRSYSADEGFGYVEILRSKGLRADDGLYAIPLDQWAPVFTADLFERETLSIPAHRTAIAVYDRDLMSAIDDDNDYTRPSGEFFYFRDPRQKRRALVGVLLQKPIKLDRRFERLPNIPKKIEFLKTLLPTINRENQEVIAQLIEDLYRSVSRQLYAARGKVRQTVEQYKVSIDALEQKRHEFAFVDEWSENINFLRKRGKRQTPGMSVDFICSYIQEELQQENISEIYREQLLALLREAQSC